MNFEITQPQVILSAIILIFNVICYLKLETISKYIQLYDYPDGIRKLHKNKTSLSGGVFVFLSIIIYMIFFSYLNANKFEYFYLFSNKSTLLFFSSLTLIFILGFLDDKFSISPDKKLLCLFFIIYLYVLSDSTVNIENITFSFTDQTIIINKSSPIFTTLVIVTFIICSNMFDGINGQSSLFFIFTILALLGFNQAIFGYLLFILILILIFFYFNIKGKVFLGDNGIFVISFVIAIFYLKTYNIYGAIDFDQMILIAFIPIIDMIRVSILRTFNGKNPMSPDRNHIHHLIENKFRLIFIIFLTSLPISLYFVINNFFISFIITIIFYIFIILNYMKNRKKISSLK